MNEAEPRVVNSVPKAASQIGGLLTSENATEIIGLWSEAAGGDDPDSAEAAMGNLEWLAQAGQAARETLGAIQRNIQARNVHDHFAAERRANGRPVPDARKTDGGAKSRAVADQVRAEYTANGRKPL